MPVRTLAAIAIYLASYLPLSLILLIQDVEKGAYSRSICKNWLSFSNNCYIPIQNPEYSVTAFVLCLLSLAFSLVVLAMPTPQQPITVSSANHIPADLMNYVLPYIVSFMSLDYADSNKFLGFLIFFFWIFLITHKSGQVIMNPVLTVFGWRLYDIEYQYVSGSGKIYSNVALSKIEISPGDTVDESLIENVTIIRAHKD